MLLFGKSGVCVTGPQLVGQSMVGPVSRCTWSKVDRRFWSDVKVPAAQELRGQRW